MDDDLGIRVRSEVVTFAFEFLPEFCEVVDLSVVSDPDGAVFVTHRHVADGGEVEDGETPTSQADVGTIGELAVPQSGVVWAAMRLDITSSAPAFPDLRNLQHR